MTKTINACYMALKFIALAVFIVAVTEFIFYIPAHKDAQAGMAPNPTDFITIVLAAVAVILTALAIILAIAGVVGYTQIKDEAVKTAVATVDKLVPRQVNEMLPRQVLLAMKQQHDISNESNSNEIAKAEAKSTE